MENRTPSFIQDTLMAELGSWNKQENKISELFSKDALKDREFMKMKLGEYDRLWIKYSGKVQTTDEKAMMIVLRFQRKKLERTLHPGLISRLVRNAKLSLKSFIQKRHDTNEKKLDNLPYDYNTIKVPETGEGNMNRQTSIDHQQGQRYGRNMGRRLRNEPNKQKGQSI